MNPNIPAKRYDRAAASAYLAERWGISRTVGTLAKLAVTGGGPRFQRSGRKPLYPQSELDAWAEKHLSPLYSSTSDLRPDPDFDDGQDH